MKRLTFILLSPLSENHPKHLSTLYKNGELLIDYVQSDYGGGYVNDEFAVIENPTLEDIEKIHELSRGVDIVQIFYCGHGAQQNGKVFIQLNDNEEIWVSELMTTAKRQITVIETCRKETIWQYDRGGIAGAQFSFSKNHLEISRKLYAHYVQQSSKGHVVLYSCSPNEYSGIGNEGGYYTNALISSLAEWGKNNVEEYITVKSVFEKSFAQMKKMHSKQSPVCNYTFESLKIPFGVNPKALLLRSGTQQTNKKTGALVLGLFLGGVGLAMLLSD